MSVRRADPAPKRVLADRFELREVLGTGGMATVWSAYDRRLGRTVAVKILRDDLSEEHAHRIEREARAAARISDHRVVTVLDLEHDEDGTPFLVLEALEGRTLADELRDGPLPLERARQLADDLLGGLAAAHERGVLHRDIKPSNLLPCDDGYRLTDFGIASLDDEASTTGDLMGTLVYLAPERFDGAPATPRSDVFSAAAVIYEALCGHQPFRGATAADSLQRLRNGRFEPLPSRVPAALADAVARGLDPEPTQRPADAGAFARLVADDRPAPTERLDVAEATDATVRLDQTTTLPGPRPDPPSRDPQPTATTVFRPEPPRPEAPADPWWEHPRVEAFRRRASTPQAIFVTVAVLLLLAVFVAAAASGDGSTDAPTGDPAAQLDARLDRIEELGR